MVLSSNTLRKNKDNDFNLTRSKPNQKQFNRTSTVNYIYFVLAGKDANQANRDDRIPALNGNHLFASLEVRDLSSKPTALIYLLEHFLHNERIFGSSFFGNFTRYAFFSVITYYDLKNQNCIIVDSLCFATPVIYEYFLDHHGWLMSEGLPSEVLLYGSVFSKDSLPQDKKILNNRVDMR